MVAPGHEAATLATALKYENPAIPRKFLESWRLPLPEARDLFGETKRWLWLAARLQRESAEAGRPLLRLAIDGPLFLLDEMWHTFILFTHEYTGYCQACFGHYLHHAPTTWQEQAEQRRQFARAPKRALAAEAERMKVQYRYVHDHLGEATLLKWYSQYPKRYTPSFLRSIRLLPGGVETAPRGRSAWSSRGR